eukprot:scaffold606002_cov14-Prasinocladus_malaysianus.AAC.1
MQLHEDLTTIVVCSLVYAMVAAEISLLVPSSFVHCRETTETESGGTNCMYCTACLGSGMFVLAPIGRSCDEAH